MRTKTLTTLALILLAALPAQAYRGPGRVDPNKQPTQSKQSYSYSYVSRSRFGSGRRAMRKETKQA